MNKKKQILELFEKHEIETEFDGNAINNKQYSELAEKLLNILFVRNQRKLLLDFAEYSENDKTSEHLDELVDNYLDNIN